MGLDLIAVDEAQTLYGLLRTRCQRAPDAPAYREVDPQSGAWTVLNWRQTLDRVDRMAAALAAAGARHGDRVAIFLQNCVDWICFDMAAHKLGLPVVPLYTNDALANTAYVLRDARPRVVLLDTAERWRAISDALGDSTFISETWVRDPATRADHAAAQPGRCRRLNDAMDAAAGQPTEPRATPDDPAALIYTSGTTGAPKGAILTHTALLSNSAGVAAIFPPRTDDTFLSVLPLAHGFERTMGYLLPLTGGSCVAFSQSLLRLREDLATIRPTALMGVPRLYESIYAAARRAAAKSPLRLRLFDTTARIGWKRFEEHNRLGTGPTLSERLAWPLLNRLVAARIKSAFGGRLRVAVSGGASFPPQISRALIGLGVPIVEGYGLTEAGPVVTASLTKDYRPNTVGFTLPGIETRFDPNGELSIRSPANMQGYWQNPEATAELIDPDGWMRTGDLARMEQDRLHISGRLKHILVLSNGENVNPTPLETAIETDPLFVQNCIAGDGRSHLTALVVLNPQIWEELAAKAGLDPAAPNAPKARTLLQKRIKARLTAFPAHQQVRGLHASLEEWTVEARLVTPTLKLRRDRIIAAHADDLNRLYAATQTA